MAHVMTKKEYVDIFGPTRGDKVHLSDTGLVIEIEKDFAEGHYGDEVIAGGGKSCRDGMAQKPGLTTAEGGLDLVITNMIFLDPILGVIKGDMGIKNGKIVGIGKAGNPDIMKHYPAKFPAAGLMHSGIDEENTDCDTVRKK